MLGEFAIVALLTAISFFSPSGTWEFGASKTNNAEGSDYEENQSMLSFSPYGQHNIAWVASSDVFLLQGLL